ncbi:hypothetical protein AVEN_517-1 [Araneus ventricosus]|uniref:Uncharacterized protein n=1 Tax=Araneus ventricosus TaxID=182803 RepID=A0A4Y2WT70_ARAVE|nr:hypothetical protein AVEN_517-1 [Araneus ventricosus]
MEQQDASFQYFLSEEEITWNHIPTRVPHHGGLWEVGVKSFKFYFKRVKKEKPESYEGNLKENKEISGQEVNATADALKVSNKVSTKSVKGKSVCLHIRGPANAITQKLEKPDG